MMIDKEKIRRIKGINIFIDIYHYCIYVKQQIEFKIFSIKRQLFPYKYETYNKMKRYKDIHLGERCFIVANGPSLTIDDLKQLKNEYTFGMNALCKVANQDDIKFTYYGIQDPFVYEKLHDEIKKINVKEKFYGDWIKNAPQDGVMFQLNLLDHILNGKLNTKYSNDCEKVVYDGYSITYSLIQIATYMGFKEIYLLGADCNYNSEKKHFVETNVALPDNVSEASIRLNYSFGIAKEYAEKNNIKIYNATRGGMLDVFPRVILEDILAD